MEVDYIVLAMPGFLLLMGIELGVARLQRRRLYRLADTVNNLSCGIIQQVVGLLLAGLLIAGYLLIAERFSVFELDPGSGWTWLGCYLAIDFAYYWFHRLSHEVNFLWAAHVVHHQSEDYNLGVALRQSSLQQFMSMVFYWPLALVGFPPLVFVACLSFNTLYQFWIHTRTIGRLGPLEHVLMTPSHHRVHHGRNPIYIDRNHAATFIVWDKLFGTFQEEGEEVAYGITTPLASWNPIWANLHYWVELWQTARQTEAWSDKLRVFLKPPGWLPADRGGPRPPPPVVGVPDESDPALGNGVAWWTGLQFAQVGALAVALLFGAGSLSSGSLTLASAGVVWGLTNLGALLEGRDWACRSELLRIVAMPAICLTILPVDALPWLIALLAANGLASRWLGIRFRGLEAGATRRSTASTG